MEAAANHGRYTRGGRGGRGLKTSRLDHSGRVHAGVDDSEESDKDIVIDLAPRSKYDPYLKKERIRQISYAREKKAMIGSQVNNLQEVAQVTGAAFNAVGAVKRVDLAPGTWVRTAAIATPKLSRIDC